MRHPLRPGSAEKPVRARILRQVGEEPTTAAQSTEVIPSRLSASATGRWRRNLAEELGSPRLQSLARPPEAHQRNVIALTAAGGELLDDLDHLLTQLPGGVGLPLYGGIQPFRLQLEVLDVRGLRDAVGERQDAVAGLQGYLARAVLEAVEHAEGQAGHCGADRLFH